MEMSNIKNKVALVTGGACGLGYLYVEELLRNDAKRVAILDWDESSGETALEKLKVKFGQERVIFLTCDVSDVNQLKDCIKKVIGMFDGLDILINNAGILDDTRQEETIKINVMGVMYGTLVGLDYMSKENGGKGGTIVNVSSIVGLRPAGILPIYSASKHAVVGFSQSMQFHYQRTGVRVLVWCPGVTITSMIDNPSNKVIDIVNRNSAAEQLASLPSQSAEHVAQSMMKIIEKGENGTIWVCEGGQPPYTVSLPHYSTLRMPV